MITAHFTSCCWSSFDKIIPSESVKVFWGDYFAFLLTLIIAKPRTRAAAMAPKVRQTYSSDKSSATTFYADGSTYYENGNGYSEYHDRYGYGMTEYADGSYDVEEDGVLYHYDCYGNLVGMQVFNGSYYETVF